MNLPQLTKIIGEQLEDTNQNDNSSLYSLVDTKILKSIKNEEQGFAVYLVFDFDSDRVFFEIAPEKVTEEFLKNYYYFGNNSGASLQYYLARSVNSLHFLFGSIFSNLIIKLNKHGMQKSELANLIEQLQEKELITTEPSYKNLCINLEKFKTDKVKYSEKSLKIDEQVISYESFIRKQINEINKTNKLLVVIPAIKENNVTTFLSKQPDYLKLVKIENNLTDCANEKEADRKEGRVCYICHQNKLDVKSEQYTTTFHRSRINKVFTTTTKNSSYYSMKFGNYDSNYSFCNDCFKSLLRGEGLITDLLTSRIAGERVYIIPEGLVRDFSYEYTDFKKFIDLAFKNTANEWLKELDISGCELFGGTSNYSINFVFYQTDGKSFSVLETIEDVEPSFFKKIVELFEKHSSLLKMKYSFSLGSVYRMIPVKADKKNRQLDIVRVLSMFKSLLLRELINTDVLFTYAVESLEKGINQINKKDQNNSSYKNLGWKKYLNKNDSSMDFYIKNLIDNFFVLISTCNDLNILTYYSSVKRRVLVEVEPLITFSDQVNESIKEMEEFLLSQKYPDEAKSLFFLGTLVNRVAVAQMQKEHKTKPILKKIQFQGMSISEINRLYNDVVEKLRQYNKITIFTEGLMNRYHAYHGSYEEQWQLSETANVFYLMSGYAYMVGRKAPDLSKKEQDVMQENLNNTEDDQNEMNYEEEK